MLSPGQNDSVTVTIFCQNEEGRIGNCIASVATAQRNMILDVDVILNGSRDRSEARAVAAIDAHGIRARVFRIAYPDKSNAINQAFYRLRLPASVHVYLDGYAVIGPATLTSLADTLHETSHATAATGIAVNGRTSIAATDATLKVGGRLHGQLHAFRSSFLDRLTAAALRLPVGLYRGDGLLGSMACHNLDAVGSHWDNSRVKGVATATYEIPQLWPLSPADMARQFRRKVRQMRGRLENEAIKWLIYTGGYASLPEYADDMIAAWLAQGHRAAMSLADRPFMELALRQHRRAQRPEPSLLQPQLIFHQTVNSRTLTG